MDQVAVIMAAEQLAQPLDIQVQHPYSILPQEHRVTQVLLAEHQHHRPPNRAISLVVVVVVVVAQMVVVELVTPGRIPQQLMPVEVAAAPPTAIVVAQVVALLVSPLVAVVAPVHLEKVVVLAALIIDKMAGLEATV